MSTIADTFAAVAREVEAVIEEARASDPGFDRKVNQFGAFAMRAVFTIKPSPRFHVELNREVGDHIESVVLGERVPPPRDASARTH
jgi:hypothetical protein